MIDSILSERIVSACGEIAKGPKIVATAIYGSRAAGYARKDSDYDILLIIRDYPEKVRYHYKSVDSTQLAVLAVDQRTLEADVEKGALGDFVTGRLLTQYIPIEGQDYLRRTEISIKKRFTEEELRDLVIEYGELARGLTIRPEYLVLARMEKRARTYSPLRYSYINMLRQDLREGNLAQILDGYCEALRELQRANVVEYDGSNIKLQDAYVDKVLSYKMLNKVVNIVDFSRRTFSSYVTHGRAGKVTLDVVAKELTSKLKRELQVTFNRQELEDPKNYLFLETQKGLQRLNKTDAMVEKIMKIRGTGDVSAQTLASVLNDVYFADVDGEKFVAKKFTDWYNLKWFVLNVVAYGTKIFSLQGKTRLANEYVMNRFLAENGIPVPEVVSVSIPDRMLIERFIDGISVLDLISETMNKELLTEVQEHWASEIGRLIAHVHSLNVVLGDCKPENLIIGNDGKIYAVDLEQGERNGDASWDIAEFLHFSGHFGTRFSGGFRQFVKAFIKGYLTIGDPQTLRKAASVKYSKIFLAWTPMPMIQGIVEQLQQVKCPV